MNPTSVSRPIGRAAAAMAFVAAAAISLASPQTAYARHGNGAAIALGVIGGAIAGAAIASAAAPGYYAPPPAYYNPYGSQAYSTAPAYYYAPPPYYAPPTPYYRSQYYGGY